MFADVPREAVIIAGDVTSGSRFVFEELKLGVKKMLRFGDSGLLMVSGLDSQRANG